MAIPAKYVAPVISRTVGQFNSGNHAPRYI